MTIQGTSELLMNRPSALIGDISKDNKGMDARSARDQAEDKLYLLDGKLVQPSIHIQSALVEAGKAKKIAGKGKSTYSKVVGYAVEVNPFEIEHKIQTWEPFSILAVNPSTRGRTMTHRPMLKSWELDFEVTFDESEIPQSIMKELLDIAGKKVGIGDWRPAKKGRFGKFQVTRWEEIK